ncbi:MAG: hypothetical protein AAF597_14125 [Bacteroidota bacterium]
MLKAGTVSFVPPLPLSHSGPISRLTMGNLIEFLLY